jgi:hypothetical protein
VMTLLVNQLLPPMPLVNLVKIKRHKVWSLARGGL